GALEVIKELVEVRDRIDVDAGPMGLRSEVVELELSLEREHGLVRATAGALVEANQQLAEQSRELAELATTDHLTQLRNRRFFTQQLERALWGSRSSDSAFSLLFLDVDGFKRVNDLYGHETGDLV